MWYIYPQPNFIIPQEFQDWLVWAWNGTHNWTNVIDISGNWNNGAANWWVVLWRKNNAWYWNSSNTNVYNWLIDYHGISCNANCWLVKWKNRDKSSFRW